MMKVPPCRRARSAILAVPERRVTLGSTPTPSSRQTISTAGSAAPGPEGGGTSAPPGTTPLSMTSTVTEEAWAWRATLLRFPR